MENESFRKIEKNQELKRIALTRNRMHLRNRCKGSKIVSRNQLKRDATSKRYEIEDVRMRIEMNLSVLIVINDVESKQIHEIESIRFKMNHQKRSS